MSKKQKANVWLVAQRKLIKVIRKAQPKLPEIFVELRADHMLGVLSSGVCTHKAVAEWNFVKGR